MGLLRRDGVPIGSMGDFHPAPDALRSAIRSASDCASRHGEKLEVVAIRFALETWLRVGARVGGLGAPLARAADADPGFLSVASLGTGRRLGVSVMGVSTIAELDETLRVWHSIVDGLENWNEDDDASYFDTNFKSPGLSTPSLDVPMGDVPTASNILTPQEDLITDRAWSHTRGAHILQLAREIRDILGIEWVDYVWASPSPDFVNSLSEEHVAVVQRIEAEERTGQKPYLSISDTAIKEDPILTPPSDVEKQLA
jgi:Aldo/keto reductase family.